MDTTHYRGRFAPSPTGPLHFGSLLAALGSWLLARHAGGRWLVRIEDVDRGREVPGAARDQLETLAAFGLQSDEPVLWQSRRGERYRELLQQLLQHGQAFPCSCSRSELAAAGGIHHRCVAAAARDRPAVRLRVPSGSVLAFDDLLRGRQCQDVHAEVGDFVLLRADGCWAYQLAVVADDADQGITDVVRGADLLDSTARQILLQRTLGLPTPRYLHLPLVTDAGGHKLSKSMASLPLDREAPLPALALAWRALGQAPAAITGTATPQAMLQSMLRHFDPALIPRRSIPFGPLQASDAVA